MRAALLPVGLSLLVLTACIAEDTSDSASEDAVSPQHGEQSSRGFGEPSVNAARDEQEVERQLGVDREDPEPPEAQALAEAVLDSPWNSDKTTRLKMSITTLVDRTSGITGFGSRLAVRDASIEDRLSALGAEVTEREITIRLAGSVLFDFDSATLRPDAERTLLELLEVLKVYAERPVRIEGHTDSIASEAYNQKLSEERAASVRDWLLARGTASPSLQTLGHGESRPVADNSTAAGRQLNRRVEVVIEKGA